MSDEKNRSVADAEEAEREQEVAEREQEVLGKTSGTPHPGNVSDETLRTCRNERESMSPHDTAECAGEQLSEEYQNEEDGGS